MVVNTQHRVARTWFAIAALGVFMSASTFIFDIDIFAGGGALVVFGLLIAITGIVTGFIYRGRALLLDKVIEGQQVLARWEYDDMYWRQYTATEHTTRVGEVRGMFTLVFWIALVVCAGLFFMVKRDRWIIPVIFLGLMAIMGGAAFLGAWLPHKRNVERRGAAVISKNGAYFAGEFHTWGGSLMRFDDASVSGESNDPAGVPLLAITYSAPTRQGWQTQTVRIPIPPGREEEAASVAASLNSTRSV